MSNHLRTTCLINNYNYADYVCEAVESAIEQSRPFDEIILIDDGSTDDSLAILKRQFQGCERLRIIAKPNEGQLSCFHAGLEAARGDYVFFLDADDRFQSCYCESVCDLLQTAPEVDFISVDLRYFGSASNGQHAIHKPTRDWGISTIAAIMRRTWIGNPTSCISMRLETLKKILPYPDARAWRTRADDVLVLGASIVGARKYHLGKSLVDYRLHGENGFAQREKSATEAMQYHLQINRMVSWYTAKMGFDRYDLPWLLSREFRTIENPQLKEWFRYVTMVRRSPLPIDEKFAQIAKMTRHYLGSHNAEKNPINGAELEIQTPAPTKPPAVLKQAA